MQNLQIPAKPNTDLIAAILLARGSDILRRLDVIAEKLKIEPKKAGAVQ